MAARNVGSDLLFGVAKTDRELDIITLIGKIEIQFDAGERPS